MELMIDFTCKECCQGSIQCSCMHPGYFGAIWLKETHICDIKKAFKRGQTQGLKNELFLTDFFYT